MAGSVARKQTGQYRNKVKTGCATCRTRKIKCDESKPFCQKCVGTGRICDGYESPFRFWEVKTSQTMQPTQSMQPMQPILPPKSIGPTLAEIGTETAPPQTPRQIPSQVSPQDVDRLQRCFSTKTVFDVKLDCDEEARQVLQASLTDPAIQHAVSSLRALRDDLDCTLSGGDGPLFEAAPPQTPSYGYGLQQYCLALGGLASHLSSPGANGEGLRSALLCCQVFISIEQVRGNYAAMAQHMVQGLRIMHEHRVRPNFAAAATGADTVVAPAYQDQQLPQLDVFIIKLFAAPCKFADPPQVPAAVTNTNADADADITAGAVTTADINEATASMSLTSTHNQLPVGSSRRQLRTIVPDMRTELTRIAILTLTFLSNVSEVASTGDLCRLLSVKASLLASLESWFADLELARMAETGKPPAHEPLSVLFSRLFHQILKIVLLGALDASADLYAELRAEHELLQSAASHLGERVKGYRMDTGTRGG